MTADTDFVAQPALSPGGHHLAWMAWNHPDMPWDRTELRVGRLEAGTVRSGRPSPAARPRALQPVWLDDDELLYADDPRGRWNIWRMRLDADLDHEDVAPADADTGGRLWVLGTRWFAPLADGRIVAIRTNGADEIVVIDPRSGDVRSLGLEATANVVIEDVSGTRVLVSGSGAASPPGIWLVDVEDRQLRSGSPAKRHRGDAEWMPRARAVTYEGAHGPVHAFDYPPTNPEAQPARRRAAPYLVLVHGGPDGARRGRGIRKIAYFTSRGIGVLDVNYGGSTGYGRAYRERLRGRWGVVDVDDVAAAVERPRRGGPQRMPRVSPSRAARGRMDRARRPRGHRRVRAPASRATASAMPARWRRRRTTSRRTTSTVSSDRSPQAEQRVRRAVAAQPRPSSSACRCCCCRAPRTGWCRRRSPRRSATPSLRAESLTPMCCTRERATVSGAARRSSTRSRRNSRSSARCSGSRPRTCRRLELD